MSACQRCNNLGLISERRFVMAGYELGAASAYRQARYVVTSCSCSSAALRVFEVDDVERHVVIPARDMTPLREIAIGEYNARFFEDWLLAYAAGKPFKGDFWERHASPWCDSCEGAGLLGRDVDGATQVNTCACVFEAENIYGLATQPVSSSLDMVCNWTGYRPTASNRMVRILTQTDEGQP